MEREYLERWGRTAGSHHVAELPTCRGNQVFAKPYANLHGTQRGHVVCFINAAQPIVAWSDESLAIVAVASSESVSLSRLYEWWKADGGPVP